MNLTKGILLMMTESREYMMRVMSIFEWNHNKIDQDHNDNEGEALNELIETITCSMQ